MSQIVHSFVYGISRTENEVRKVTVSRDNRNTYVSLDALDGQAVDAERRMIEHGRTPLQEARLMFDLDETVEVPADLDDGEVGEKTRADLEVKVVERARRLAQPD